MNDFKYQTALRPKHPGSEDIVRATVRFDDDCRNGHQSFGLTASIYGPQRIRNESNVTYNKRLYWCWGQGACHEEIISAFPELAPYTKWHLTSTDGPMHYIANGKFWAELWQASVDPQHRLARENDSYLTQYTTEQLRAFFCHQAVIDPTDPVILDYENGIVGWSLLRVNKWLAERLPGLQAGYMADMEKVRDLEKTLTSF